MLTLGKALQRAAGPSGTAYRIGGDEFCLLTHTTGDDLVQLKRRTAQALTTVARAVPISSSWGAATIPTEASDPKEALQLADVRMYAQKESRRVAATPRPEEPAKVSAWPRATQSA